MTELVIHGHFYQPPRENPWTGRVDREPSARPFHDWNERIHAECYRPNAFARVVDPFGRVEAVLCNYAHVSFNVGPTLLSWMELHDPVTYGRIIDADQESARRCDGHGNAIAQAYSHPILPLCNESDRRTQIRWGIADFRHRFCRDPEALWLPETACNDATLGALIDEELRFVILSPYQAARVRSLPEGKWRDVADGGIDPGISYRYFHRDGSGRSIAVFFYDGPISRAVAFEGVLASSQAFVNRLAQAPGGEARLVHIATDGESYGHHTRLAERGLAYALSVEAPARGFTVTNYGSFLERHPPTMEVEIQAGPDGEGTAWSCAHGVGRWCRDCSCQTGGQPGWNQAWRTPLRAALDHLRDAAAHHFAEVGGDLFVDPWAARDTYIDVLLDRSRRDQWLDRVCCRPLSTGDRIRALSLIEIQRHAQLMYTSCGWFFTELSGIETVQVLKYAGRVLSGLEELDLGSPRERFLEILAEARSNLPEMGTGADVFHRFVDPQRVSVEQVAASLAIASLVGEDGLTGETVGFRFERSYFRKERHGRSTLATGRLQLEELASGRRFDYARASMHLGGVDFYCALRPYPGDERFREAAERLWSAFHVASLPTVLRTAQTQFGPDEYGLDSVLGEDRERISGLVYGEIVDELAADYGHVYQRYERIIEMLEGCGFELPSGLQRVADFTRERRLEHAIREAHRAPSPATYRQLLAVGREVAARGLRLDNESPTASLLSDVIAHAVEGAMGDANPDESRQVVELCDLAQQLNCVASLERAQELAGLRAGAWAWLREHRDLMLALRLAPAFYAAAAASADPGAQPGAAGHRGRWP